MSRLGSLALRVGVGAALIGWLLTRVGLGELATELAEVGLASVLSMLALQFLNTALKSYKWQQLLAADGIALPHRTVFASYMVGTFFSVFLPTAVGGDAVRAVDTGRRSGRRMATATSVVADRVLGFAAIGLVGLAALATGAAATIDTSLLALGASLYLAVLAAAVVAFTDFLGRAARRLGRFGWSRLERTLGTIADSIAAYRRSGRLVRWALLSVAAQVIVVVAVWVLARSLAIPIPLSYFFAIVPLVSLVESLPVSIFGIGTRDVSYVYLLGLVGVSDAKALSLSLLYVLLTLLYALLGGLVFAFRSPAPAELRMGE
ncbi:MAG: flippase-like domain-containing protein [Chloroflexi bacterium]|nr:flippase-like domain-containing protein [Chloroflexota bacterium]